MRTPAVDTAGSRLASVTLVRCSTTPKASVAIAVCPVVAKSLAFETMERKEIKGSTGMQR